MLCTKKKKEEILLNSVLQRPLKAMYGDKTKINAPTLHTPTGKHINKVINRIGRQPVTLSFCM